METRYHIDNGRMMIEAPHNQEGKKKLEGIRKLRRSYKGRRIKSILQAYPSKIRYYREYKV